MQLKNYLTVNGLHERFKSTYKAQHNTETPLLTVTNDILLSLDMGDNVFLLLLGLSFWREKVVAVIILLRVFRRMSCCRKQDIKC